VRPISPLLFRGKSIPAILAIILSLSLFKLWVLLVDDIELAFAANHFALYAPFFDGGFDFHGSSIEMLGCCGLEVIGNDLLLFG
jgi:hypothetical protein